MSDLLQEKASNSHSVLARKYRPSTFSEVIGQQALVQTLTNAINNNRLANAYILTGVRGIGKTTTARIIAKALNCVGTDGNGGPTPEPCGECEFCRAITEDRLMDVVEIDAASHTGVDGIRDIIDSVRYRPASARFKIYVIDEVHMLSKGAFNALLKTLEEPPEHVKFIFATTEIREVPVTVLSRCQRFDLRRADIKTLHEHLEKIASKENAEFEEEAIRLIAKAADGSVRDGMSILDQAIAHSSGNVTAKHIRDMIGLADSSAIFELFDFLMRGEIDKALAALENLYVNGADPLVIAKDMLETVHLLTKAKVVPMALGELTENEKNYVKTAEKLSMSILTRSWQMLLKGINEITYAPSALQALEMLLIRIAYATELPSPEELVKKALSEKPATSADVTTQKKTPEPVKSFPKASFSAPSNQSFESRKPFTAPQKSEPANKDIRNRIPESFREVVELFEAKKEPMLTASLKDAVKLVEFKTGHIKVNLKDYADKSLPSKVSRMLQEWTGIPWVIALSDQQGEDSLLEQEAKAANKNRLDAADNPLVKKTLNRFKGSKVTDVKYKETTILE